jgi:DNA-binding transcriptional ArsR family regulator
MATASSCRRRPSVPEPDVFAAVASPTRRRLLQLLLERGPQPVQELADHFAMRRPSVSEHLKVLKDAGLVAERKSGRQRVYSLHAEPLGEVAAWLTPYERFWRDKLTNLRDLLDSEDDDRPEPDHR